MPGSRLGEYFSVINFGESHGPAWAAKKEEMYF